MRRLSGEREGGRLENFISQSRQKHKRYFLKIGDSVYQNKRCHCKVCKNKNPTQVGHSAIRVVNDRKKCWE